MITRTLQRHAAFLTTPAVTVPPPLVVCGPDDVDGVAQDVANASEATSSAGAQETDAIAGEIIMKTEPVNDLPEGDVITVDLSGLDPDYGYHTIPCATEKAPGDSIPDCTGDRSAGTQSQQWITKKSGGATTIADDNTAHSEPGVVPIDEAVDCTQQNCVLKLFGDRNEGFKGITEIPVTFTR